MIEFCHLTVEIQLTQQLCGITSKLGRNYFSLTIHQRLQAKKRYAIPPITKERERCQMEKIIEGCASNSEAVDKQELNLCLGPCFDLTLSATEAIKIFDDRSKMRLDQNQAADDAPASEKPTPKQPLGNN